MQLKNNNNTLKLLGFSTREVLHRLKESADFSALEKNQNPEQVLNELFLLLGRNLAVATSFLPEDKRQEGIVTFLCCRVLDAHEDMHLDGEISAQNIEACVDYLRGKKLTPPDAPSYSGNRETDLLECLLAKRLEWVKLSLDSLDNNRREQVQDLLQNLALYMAEDRREGRFGGFGNLEHYGRQVLGRIVEYSLTLLGLTLPESVDVKAIGHVLQTLNHIRDFNEDSELKRTLNDEPAAFLKMTLELIETALIIPSSLEELDFKNKPKERAAITYMVATSMAFLCKQTKTQGPWVAVHPVSTARLSQLSQHFFNHALYEIDTLLYQLITYHMHSRSGLSVNKNHFTQQLPGRRYSMQEHFELSIADQHPAPNKAKWLKHYIRVSRFSFLLLNQLPTNRISQQPRNHIEGHKIMISDYFMASATTSACNVGVKTLSLLSNVGSVLIDDMETGLEPDTRGIFAHALTTIVLTAQGANDKKIELLSQKNKEISKVLYYKKNHPQIFIQKIMFFLTRLTSKNTDQQTHEPSSFIPLKQPLVGND